MEEKAECLGYSNLGIANASIHALVFCEACAFLLCHLELNHSEGRLHSVLQATGRL